MDKSYIDLFEEQVLKTPGNIAVVFEQEQLSYLELNQRSNKLAYYLRDKGVLEDTLVPLYMERGIHMLVAMLGIMKAGGAYVPIDTDFPPERIRFMLKDTGAKMMVSSKESGPKLSSVTDIDIIEIENLPASPTDNLPVRVLPRQLAYVIYTSGSTGVPKGVMIEHSNLVDYVQGLIEKTHINECRSFALVSTIATDLGNTVIYGSLVSGGALHLFTKESVSNIEYLHRYFSLNKIDCLKIVPSHWKVLNMDEQLLLPEKLLVFGGEALPGTVVEDIRLSGSRCVIVNHYGPTETTIGKLLHIVDPAAKYEYTVPIGKPFSNTKVLVLTKNLKLCPIGIPGQLYITGDGVARGYWNNPQLTSEKFIQNPFSKQAGSVMYNTGDMVKYLPDGNISFIGRADNQVKIRGYRIEPGEVEMVLQRCGLVSQAVVMANEDGQGNKRLVGYIVAEGAFDREGIISYLKEKLPEYMIPALLMEMEELPLTANGKVDRNALPDPEAMGLQTSEYLAPRNDVEAKLAALWQDVLEAEQVGMNDDFFELGGHSLLAVRLVSAIRKAFAVEMPIGDIFDHPTVGLLAAQLANNTDNKLLTAIRAEMPRPDRIPLSFSQERLWFIDQLGGSQQYHIPSVLRLKGKLDKDALSNALKQIVNRHEVLRTVISQDDGLGYQQIKDKDGWQLQTEDGSVYKDDLKGLQFYIKQLTDLPFDLSRDYMLRAVLVDLEEDEHLLVVTLHHIASDGWSTSIIVAELVELYNAQIENRASALAALPVQYADFAIWQRKYLQEEAWDKKLAYWKEKLEGVPALQLTTDYPRPLVQSTEGAFTGFKLDKELSAQLQSLSQQQGATLFMTLLAVFNVLLYRYTGQQQICVGTPVAGRQQQELEGLIGFFVNTLVLRSELNAAISFRELLHQVKITTLEAYEHQDSPFEKVVDMVVKERDLGRSPLFQVMLVLQNTPEISELRLGDLELSRAATGASAHQTSKFELTLNVVETAEGLHISVEYCTALFKEQTVKRMMTHFKELLNAVVIAPGQSIGALPLLTIPEKKELLEEFNNNATNYPKEKSIVGLFEEQSIKTPQASAIVFEETTLSYEELNKRSNQFAHYLQSKGVGAETLVPICIERGVEMLVGILGILKAGGAYVPIDPSYPAERIRFMLEDTGAMLVVTSVECRQALQLAGSASIIEIDGADREMINSQPVTNLQAIVNPGQLAYVIYTSGSTGRPKGTMVEHGNVVSLVRGADYLSLTEDETVLSTGSPSFDATTFEYWSMLLNGGKLILCTEDRLLNPELLKQEIRKRKVTMMWFTASWFNQLVDSDISLFEGLKTVLAGGEKLSELHIGKMRKAHPSIKLINGYGPTENTTFSLTCNINTTAITGTVPIGRPLNNRQAYILDGTGQLVPVGVPGEIYLAGAGLSRGYLNRPELTAERFIEVNLSGAAGKRMYKTGDLGRWLPDGNIEYLGRIDDQVKIRGYRIELGEIESVLGQSKWVLQSVVLAKENREGNRQLVAYVVAATDFTKEAVMDYLRCRLPEYMVPQIWVELEQLPLTSNGKIDKKALPDVDAGDLLTSVYVAPRNELEKSLAETWQKLLGIERAGIHDNFFELGGDSIVTIQVVSRMRRLGYELQPKDIFIHQTIGKLSLAIAERAGSETTGEQGLLTGFSGLLPIQQWWLEKNFSEVSHFNQAVLLGIDKAVTENTIRQSIEHLTLQHDALRFSYQFTDGAWEQEYGSSAGGVFIEELQSAPAGSIGRLIKECADRHQRMLDIKNGELIRVVLMQTPATESHNRLLLVIHHLAVDGVSWRILLSDLELLLSAINQGQEPVLGQKSTSYRQWYQALQQYGQNSGTLSQIGYWQNTVQAFAPLPIDKEYKGNAGAADTGHQSIRLNAELTRSLLLDIPRVYHTEVNDILLCALAGTLCDWANGSKVVIGLEGHGREDIADDIDTSRTVGWFTSLYPLLLETNKGIGPGEQIKSVKEQLRRVPDRGLGYGVLKYINREAGLQGGQSWDIVFNYLGQFDNIVNESKWLKGAGESAGVSVSEEYGADEKLSVNTSVQSGELVINWSFSTLHYDASTISRLSSGFISALEKLITHCLEQLQSGSEPTPSDYGLGAEITYTELDAFLDEPFNGKKRREQVESICRLSGLQQGMLFHGLYDTEAGVYTDQFACDLVNVDLELFKLSWGNVLKNHSILRSAFYYDTFSVPVQCVFANVKVPIEVLDFRNLPDAQKLVALKEYEAADRTKGFDFKAAPLMRLALIRLTDDRYRMLWTWFHILLDGWSLPILTEEFLTTYELLSDGKQLPTKEDDRYEDFIRYIERTSKEKEEKYWRSYMKGVEQSTLLPFIGKTSERTRGVGESKALYLQFNDQVTTKIQAYAQQNHITANTIMQGVWACLLNRYTGNDDIVFGIIVSGRPDDLPAVEQRVGMYINTMPLHTRIEKERGIVEWLQEIQKEQASSRQYQHTTFNDIQSWTGVQGDLFDSIFVFQNFPISKVISSQPWKLRVENTHMHGQNNLPLTVTASFIEQISIEFRYNTGLLEESAIKEIIGHFEEALHRLINHPEGKIGDIELVSQKEQQELLVVFNDSQVAYPDKSIVGLFEEQAAKTPDSVAIVFEAEQISYQRLNERSNQLAGYLRSKGVNAETLVPLFMERGLDMMLAMLGILKAGGAYVPVDTDFPSDRITYMLEDTHAGLLLTSSASRPKLPVKDGVEIIEIDGDWASVDQYPVTNLHPTVECRQLAYVIYTSGSTGKPKGVMIEHRSLVDYVAGLQQKLQINDCRSFALVSTIATDLGNTVIYSSLLSGAALHIFSKEAVSNTESLHAYFKKHTIDCLKIVPSHWKALRMENSLLLPEKLLIFGGEALQAGITEDIRLSGTTCRVINHYGPTETTIGKLLHIVDHNRAYSQTIPIGKPFSNTRVYVLSKDLKLCPVEVPGQLYIAGDGVARGYFNNPGLTNEKFITDPFSGEADAKMYATGDLVKFLRDGNIEFIGRVDDQVKIRGYRIELGEIESVLQQCEEVSQAVVLARDDKQGNKRLVAYIVPRDKFNREDIIAYMKEKLPDYMIPAFLVELDNLPLTANGKVNRKVLPDPDAGELLSDQYTASRNDTEAKLAAIWQDVLELDRVGMNDDFFELGGHSLLAVRLISAIRKAFSIEMPIGDIFDYPTVALLAAQLANQANTIVLPPVEKAVLRPAQIPLSFSQERLWIIDQLGGSLQYHVPAVLRLKGDLNKAALAYALQSTVNRHEVLRTVYREEEGRPYQVIKDIDGWELKEVDGKIYKNDEAGLQKCIQQMINAKYNLTEDYMLRAALISLEPEDHILVVTLHHIASDGWSKSLLVNNFAAFYRAFEEGTSAVLPVLPIQYADYAMWQRSHLEGPAMEKKIGYWKEKLQGVAALQLPTDYPRPAVQSTRGAMAFFNIDSDLSVLLRSIGQQHGTTLFMTLLAVFKVLLYRYSGQQDICVGTPIAGRQQPEMEGLIGFFVNTLALRTGLSGDTTFTDLLKQVRTGTLEAFEHQEVPFEKVVEAAVKERDMSRSPVFEVMFVLRNTPEVPELMMKGVTLSRTQFQHTTALFDMTFFITENEGGMQGAVEYNADLFTVATINRMMAHFKQLLQAVVTAPQQKIGELPMLNSHEEQQLLVAFNNTDVAYPAGKTIISLFEKQVVKTPGAIAVVFEEKKLSYRQLNEQSNQLAHHLQKRGIVKGTLVPICIERSLEMIVGILGILKSGGVYVPVDPEYPEDRIRYMLDDTGAGLILCSCETRLKLPVIAEGRILEINGADKKTITRQPLKNLRVAVEEDHQVYVIYTSGSTGKPKGVRMGGVGMVNLLEWQEKQFSNKHRRVLQFASLNFDVSFQEIFSTLCFGSSLYLINSDRRRDMAELLKDIAKYQLTHLFIPFIVLKNLVEYILPLSNDAFSIKEIIVAGEQLKLTEDIQMLLSQKELRLINQYGPTEAHVVSSYTIDINNAMPALPPIGKPIDNTQLYILGEMGQPVPVGVPGELFIGGVQVAHGYLNLPELTSEKFLNDPFGKKTGGRLYKTGDLARWLEDGNIEYLGRKDDQVKIRGYRMELGEIESLLQECSLVRQAVVLAKEDSTGSKRLVGYIVPEGIFDKPAIIAFLKAQLPEYMVPALLVEMDHLPVTRNGKINRKALPDPDAGQLLQNEYVAPHNETERVLADIWQQLLNVEQVGVRDNFFDLGGHSLLAIRLVHVINKKIKLDLSISDVFIYPTIAELAVSIDRKNKNTDGQPANKYLVPLKTGSFKKAALYIVCGGGGTAKRFRKFAEMLDEDQSVFSLQSPFTSKEIREFPDTIEKTAAVFIEEILTTNPDGPYALSGHCIGGIIAFEMAKQLEARGKKVHMLAMFDTIIKKKQQNNSPSFKNFYNVPRSLKALISKVTLKLHFETFLFRKHTRQAIKYKMDTFTRLYNRMGKKNPHVEEMGNVGFEVFGESSKVYIAASKNYKISPYQGEIVLFFAKEHYYFMDTNMHVTFGKVDLNENTKNIWKQYAGSIKIHNVEGEHSTIFEPEHCWEFARLLQLHLNKGITPSEEAMLIKLTRDELQTG